MNSDSSSEFDDYLEKFQLNQSKPFELTQSKRQYNRSKLSTFKYSVKYQWKNTPSSSSDSSFSEFLLGWSSTIGINKCPNVHNQILKKNIFDSTSSNSDYLTDPKKSHKPQDVEYHLNTNSSENVQNTKIIQSKNKSTKPIKKNSNLCLNIKKKNQQNITVDILTFKAEHIHSKKKTIITEKPLFATIPRQKKNIPIENLKKIHRKTKRSMSIGSTRHERYKRDTILNPQAHYVINAVSKAITRLKFQQKKPTAPSKCNIYHFIEYIRNYADIPPEVIILMYVYIERLIKNTEIQYKNPLRLVEKTWRRIIIITLLIAYKRKKIFYFLSFFFFFFFFFFFSLFLVEFYSRSELLFDIIILILFFFLL
ncbi:hypothetical protein M0812_25839 [Anaeramoeba flamelloides]|uniref:Cyclin N-terminal domain-containing protein n=1 Tax=Anaeramoeba flamelloides TaxID=1746091 RepID=A0AAV7YJT6_9EUKA|nr:hypothetical protein M0812_25839 [Anaeramoeba flamelloides]